MTPFEYVVSRVVAGSVVALIWIAIRRYRDGR